MTFDEAQHLHLSHALWRVNRNIRVHLMRFCVKMVAMSSLVRAALPEDALCLGIMYDGVQFETQALYLVE